MWKIAETIFAVTLAVLLALLDGCGGSVESHEEPPTAPDAGAAPTSGCYPYQLACGAYTGQWCWSRPGDVSPAAGCVRYVQSGAVAFAYWCCP